MYIHDRYNKQSRTKKYTTLNKIHKCCDTTSAVVSVADSLVYVDDRERIPTFIHGLKNLHLYVMILISFDLSSFCPFYQCSSIIVRYCAFVVCLRSNFLSFLSSFVSSFVSCLVTALMNICQSHNSHFLISRSFSIFCSPLTSFGHTPVISPCLGKVHEFRPKLMLGGSVWLGCRSLAGGLAVCNLVCSLLAVCLIHGWHVTNLWIKFPLWVNQPRQLSLSSLQGW